MRRKKVWWLASLLVVGVFFVVTGCATSKNAPEKKEQKAAYKTEVCSSAKITKVDYFMKKYKGSMRLHITVGIKNVSSSPKRYRLHIFLPGGVSSGGLYPRKGKPPVIQPGKELVQTYPMYYSKIPESFELVVTELPQK
ncbi:MAG: hypothetical protein JRJ48_04820 [Deltaproteobacteria bacterium]|nr:hypothetical protein [Deltaproteobacteria bacterium]